MMLTLTAGLGIWQVQRLAWKTGLLASIDRGEATAPLPLPPNPLFFHRYIVIGQFATAQARYSAEVRQGPSGPVLGAHVIGMLLRSGAPPVAVDRGWADDRILPGVPAGTAAIEGYVRPPEHSSWMGAADDPVHRRFYALDPATIGASLGYSTVAPFTLVAIGPAGSVPDPIQAMPRPPNDHLSYAITWFSLSAALVVVFVVYVRQMIRQERSE